MILIAFGYYSIIKSVKTVMLFSCLLYFAFGLMYAYQEVLNEMRNVITMNDKTDMVPLREPFTIE